MEITGTDELKELILKERGVVSCEVHAGIKTMNDKDVGFLVVCVRMHRLEIFKMGYSGLTVNAYKVKNMIIENVPPNFDVDVVFTCG